MSWMLIMVMITGAALVGGCGEEKPPEPVTPPKSIEDVEEDSSPEAPTDLDMSVIVLEDFEEREMDSLEDVLAASPFYLPLQVESALKASGYLPEREAFVEALVQRSEALEKETYGLLALVDDLQAKSLLLARKLGEDDFLNYLEESYSDRAVDMGVMEAVVTSLSTREGDPYTHAWNQYMALQKRQDLAMMVAEDLFFAVENAVMLAVEAEEKEITGEEVSALLSSIDQAEASEAAVENILIEVEGIYRDLDTLEKADAYAHVAMMADTVAMTAILENNLALLSPSENLTIDQVELAQVNNELVKGMAALLGAGILESYGLDEVEEAKGFLGVVYAEGSSDRGSSEYLEKGKETLKTTSRKEKKEKGFFKTVWTAVRKTPGILLEKTGNYIYKKTFESTAASYGVDEKTIAEEKKRVDDEEWARIQKGEAGSAMINDGIKFIESVENSVGTLAEKALGKDSNIAKTVKGGSAFAIGLFTSSGKSTLRMMDPKASTQDLVLSTVDVALTTTGLGKVFEKVGTVAGQAVKRTSKFAGQTIKKGAQFVDDLIKPAMSKVSKVKNFVASSAKSTWNKVTSWFGRSPKVQQTVAATTKKVKDAAIRARNASVEYYQKTVNTASSMRKKLTTKYDELVSKSPKFTNEVIDEELQGGVSGSVMGYFEGLLKKEGQDMFFAKIDGEEGEDPAGVDQEPASSEEEPSEEGTEEEEKIMADPDNAEGAPGEPDGEEDPTQEESENAEEGVEEETEEESGEEESLEEEDLVEEEPEEAAPSGTSAVGDLAGLYRGHYQSTKIAGMGFEFSAANSSVQIDISEGQLKIKHQISGGLLEGSFQKTVSVFKIENNRLTAAWTDDEGDRQTLEMEFQGNQASGKVHLYDGSDYLGALPFTVTK